MRGPLSGEDIERLEMNARTPKAHEKAAVTLEAWAEESHPDDETTTAELLNAAALHREFSNERDAALALHRRAMAAPGDVFPDKRWHLHSALLKAGLHDEARQLADEIRRSASEAPHVYVFMAENHEMAGDLRQALRWLTIGLRHVDVPDEESDPEQMDFQSFYLLRSRRRVRQALGFPPDELDELVPPVDPSAYE